MNDIIGSIDTGGGNFINGSNNTILNIIDGLSVLLSDYHGQLASINSLINDFKPKTALELLDDLEHRLTQSRVPKDKIIDSKLLFLKALCKRELSGQYSREESAKDFVKAYRFNSEDTELKTRACIEFLNIDDSGNAEKLADQILEYDGYNVTAWFVKSVISADLKLFLKTVPKNVLNNYNFQHSIIYRILGKNKIKSFTELKDYSLELHFDLEKYKTLDSENKQAWVIALDLMISNVINSSALKNMRTLENFVQQSDSEIDTLLYLLDKFVEILDLTEISDTIGHQKFYQNYLKYITTGDSEYGKSFASVYDQIEKPYWFYTQFYCHFLNHKKDFQKSLDSLIEYENLKGELNAEFYLLKIGTLYHLGKIDDINTVFDGYLNSMKQMDERNLFTVILICNLSREFVSVENNFQAYLDKILNKSFVSNDLKLLTEYTLHLRFSPKYNVEEIYNSLNALKNNSELSFNCRCLIAENFDLLDKSSEALSFMNTFINKSIISESLRLYILILGKQLKSKEDTPKGYGKELLDLLCFWRKSSLIVDEELLCLEHQICAVINDFSKLVEIDYLLYTNFPDNYKYLFLYLSSLEVTGNANKIIDISKEIPIHYDEEIIGINIAGVLIRNNKNLEKGCEILFNLALEKNNTEARKNYFGMAITIDSYFENYKTVEIGNWVVYEVDGRKEKIKIVKSVGIQKDLIGKSVGQKFTQTHPLTGKLSTIEVSEIFNDYLNLFREIEEEAKSPVNDLGFYSFELPNDLKDFPKFLMEQFGHTGSDKKENIDQLMTNYFDFKISFTVLAGAVFKNNFVDAYNFLTKSRDSKFITIPNSLTQEINKLDLSLKFILDSSSVLLFYYLSNELNFEFKHRFVISFNTRHQIEYCVNLEKNSPQSTLSMNITLEGVENFIYPEDSKEKRIVFFQSILDWIDENCDIDMVEEKLDMVLKLQKHEEEKYEKAVLKTFIDSLYLGVRSNYRMISSELFVFESKMVNNFLNPEKYLTTYYPEKCDQDFYRYLLRSNYLGVNVSFEILKREFIDYIGGRENYFYKALDNLRYFINYDPNVILTCTDFFNFLNDSSLPVFSIKKFISEVFNKSSDGMEGDLKLNYMHFIRLNLNFKFS